MDEFEKKYPRRSFGHVKNRLKELGTSADTPLKKGIVAAIMVVLLILAMQLTKRV